MKQFSREELYELVWSEPLSALASKLVVSYPTLRSSCMRAAIPLPDRGHWARIAAGKPAVRARLPVRPPGLHQEVQIGGGRYRLQPQLSREEILGPIPEPPGFAEAIEALEATIRTSIAAVKVGKSIEPAHQAVRRLLRADDKRREKQRLSRWPSSWDNPLFDPPFEARRLRILNALFMALSRAAGAKPSISGREARSITIEVNDESIGLRLDTPRNIHKDPSRESLEARDAKSPMRLVILHSPWSSKERWSCQDMADRKVEQDLTEAAVRVVLAAELQYREKLLSRHRWRIERRAELIEEDRRAREKVEREERERQEQLARARIEALLAEADALTKAEAIRAYVQRVRALSAGATQDMAAVDRWADWALAVAETVDPVASGSFLRALETSPSPPPDAT